VENQFDQNKLTIYDVMTEQLPEKHRSISTHLSKQAGSPHKLNFLNLTINYFVNYSRFSKAKHTSVHIRV
jgi:hypothetical protein